MMLKQIGFGEEIWSSLEKGSVLGSVSVMAFGIMLYSTYFFDDFSEALRIEAHSQQNQNLDGDRYGGMQAFWAEDMPHNCVRNVSYMLFRDKLWKAMDLHRYLQDSKLDVLDRVLLTHKPLN